MPPQYVFRLGRAAFADPAAICEARQIRDVVVSVGAIRPNLRWYVSDVQGTGRPFVRARTPIPELVGDTTTLASAVLSFDQFQSGVFVGVDAECLHPHFREGGMWTEDAEVADLGDAIVEIRAFDTTYISLSTNDLQIADHIRQHFSGAQELRVQI